MLGSIFSRATCPIGLDIGSHSIKLLQLARGGDRIRVVAAASQVLPADTPADGPGRIAVLAPIIRRLLESGSFTGRKVVGVMPASTVTYKSLRLPNMPESELASAVEWEAADRLKLTGDGYHLQFFHAGQVRQGEELRQEVILMAVPHTAVNSQMELFTRCGLDPVAIDAVPSALGRWTSLIHQKGKTSGTPSTQNTGGEANVVIDVGFGSSTVVVTRDEGIAFVKQMDMGGRRFDELVAKKLSLSTAEAALLRSRLREPAGDESSQMGSSRRESMLRAVHDATRGVAGEMAREIALCLRYYSVTFRGEKPAHLMLVGGEADQPGVAEAIHEELNLPVEMVDALAESPGVGQSALAHRGDRRGRWALAAALSMRESAQAARRGAA